MRRAMRDRANLVGATCAVFVSVRLNGDERGTGAIARVPAAAWALACRCRQGGGREFLGERFGGQHAHGSGATQQTVGASLDALVHCRPRKASWLVRLKFWLADRQVRFDPRKYGWPWVPNTVSWVLPTSMALITLERAKRRGWICGREVENRLRLGAEMLLDRACPEAGWSAGNAVVYGVPLRPHIDATALALAALRLHYRLPIVRNSLTWILDRIDCHSA